MRRFSLIILRCAAFARGGWVRGRVWLLAAVALTCGVLQAASPATAPSTAPAPGVQADGSILLPADAARIHGFKMKLERRPTPTLVHWTDATEMAEWPHAVESKGTYEVEITYSCPDRAGGEFVIAAGAHKVTANAQHTADWKTFTTVKVGKLKVLNDHTTILLRARDNIARALINVRTIRLTPVPAEKES